jgi:AcrR family transcriptional regulator
MTETAFLVNESEPGRAERLLDSAAELLLRWGYQRVTIEDVAKHAGIGKGTVYLHFRTKDALFLTVLLRAHRRILTGVADRMEADPIELLPSRLVRGSYLAIAADPVAKLLYLGDTEVLGRLAHEAAATMGGIAERRAEVMDRYIARLRAAGAVRTDLSPRDQLTIIEAVGLGFYMSGAGAGDDDPPHRAALLGHTIAAALESDTPDRAALAVAGVEIVTGMRSLITLIDEEWRRRVR